ncbi:MAG: ABC transporter permease [Dorea sp.]|jgi:putative ABC transport system permease protein|nr:ABC transporter permease [Dorea sp.]
MKEQNIIVKTLTIRSLRKNKGRNLAAILAIILTTMMFTTLFTLAQSMGKNMTEMYLHQSGTKAHATGKGISDEEAEKIASHPDVASSGRSIVVGLAENLRLAGRQVEIRYGEDQYAKDGFAWPETGRMPERKDEIALDTLVAERLGIEPKLGEQVTLEWRKDTRLEEQTSDTFTLCGLWEGNLSSYASMAWVSEDFVRENCDAVGEPEDGQALGLQMMGISFADTEDIQEKADKVLADCGLTEVELTENLAYAEEVQQSIRMENLPVYVGMLLTFLAGYLIIYNVFQISVASDIQFYGKLKTLGATRKQIRKMILGQGSFLSVIGIPAGLILGYLLGIVLVPILMSKTENALVSANPVIFAGAVLFAFFTVMISCLLPARLAGRVSPMEALRYTDADAGSGKKMKRSTNGASLQGMAWANLWRNKKRTVLVVSSLTLGLALMSFFYAKNASFDVEKYLVELAAADFQIDDATNEKVGGYDPQSQTIRPELIDEIDSLEGLEATGRLYSRETSQSLSGRARENLESFYDGERLEEFEADYPDFPNWKRGFDEALGGKETIHTIYGADGIILDAAVGDGYVLSGTYDPEQFATGEYALAIGPSVEPQELLPTYSVGETVMIEGREFTIMAVLSPLRPMTAGMTPSFDIPLVIPADVYTELWPDSHLRKYYFNVTDEGMEEAGELLSSYQQTKAVGMSITDRKSMILQYEAETRSSAVIGYAISVVIALVGVLNFVNSMVTAIISRKKEFAMIQSVGMTKRQLGRMLAFEGLGYAGITLAVSYILSAFIVGVVVRAIAEEGYTSTFHFTLLPLAVCTPVLIGFAVLIPYICFRNLEKQSITERLRMS